jgi:hypothetical protein
VKRKLLLARAQMRRFRRNLCNYYYRRRLYAWARLVFAIALWLGTIVLANWRYDVFLTSVLQVFLVVSVVFTGVALFPPKLKDAEESRVLAMNIDAASRMFMGVALLAAFMYACFIAISLLLY